jgi:hypothetical protein
VIPLFYILANSIGGYVLHSRGFLLKNGEFLYRISGYPDQAMEDFPAWIPSKAPENKKTHNSRKSLRKIASVFKL